MRGSMEVGIIGVGLERRMEFRMVDDCFVVCVTDIRRSTKDTIDKPFKIT